MPTISLVIPVRNEEESIADLIDSVGRQSLPPDEIVLVDGGSTDRTVEIVESLAAANPRIRLIKTDGAGPGKGRNIGIEAAAHEWIALTDAGIRLEADWLEMLIAAALPPRPRMAATPPSQGGEPDVDIVYGNYAPAVKTLFEKCAAIAYVPPQRPDVIRGRSIASCLLRKDVWSAVGGFPDLRAAEDLAFMEAADRAGFLAAYEPKAIVHWQLRPDFGSTFDKFVLYSKHNVWAGRQWDWHYGIARQYSVLLPLVILAVLHSPWWLAGIALWLAARTAKRIIANRFEYGLLSLLDPRILLGVAVVILTIDAATFVGWVQGATKKQ